MDFFKFKDILLLFYNYMTEDQIQFICKNQTLWRKMYLQNQNNKLQDIRDKCRAYETNKRRQKGIKPRFQ